MNGIQRVFSIPGESFLPLLDGLLDTEIENVVCRHEGGAAIMAEAHGKITGQPGVAMVTRGPGATNASCGIHIARHDSTPMILLVGQVPRSRRQSEAFQEINVVKFFEPLAKLAIEIERVDQIPAVVRRAFAVALEGRRGPVVISLPEDMLHDNSTVDDTEFVAVSPCELFDDNVNAAVDRILAADRPVVIIGGSIWSNQTALSLGQASSQLCLPVAASFRRQDYLDNRHENYIGDLSSGMNPNLAVAIKESDCVVALGCRMADFPTQGYSLPGNVADTCLAVHVYPDRVELGRIWQAEHKVCTTPKQFLTVLNQRNASHSPACEEWVRRLRALAVQWRQPSSLPGKALFAHIVKWLSDNLPDDAILTNGAGNYAAFVHRHFCFKQFGTQLAPTSGSMGYGLPAAIAAKLQHPERVVVCFAGDGCLQMTINELATAVERKANLIVVVANNGMYGTIRMHQESYFPGRLSGTSLANPNFAELANGFGAFGETVLETSEFPAAFERAVKSNRPAVIDVKLDPQAIATNKTLNDIASMHATACCSAN